MGLIRAGIGAIGGNLADQWKEFFTCDSLSTEIFLTRGVKQSSSSSNGSSSTNTSSSGTTHGGTSGKF